MTNELALKEKLLGKTILAKIQSALTSDADAAKKYAEFALMSINKNTALAKCDDASKLQCVVEAAQYNLNVDSVSGHAYLVPYNTKVGNNWINKAQLQIGYKGLLLLARRGDPDIQNIECEIVGEQDLNRPGHFHVTQGDDPSIQHTKNWNKLAWAEGATNAPVAVYSVMTYKDGHKSRHFMPIDEVYAIRDKSSKTGDKESSPWQKFPDPMIKKTCLRQHCKLLNLSREDMRYQKAIEQDELREMGVMQGDDMAQRETKNVNGQGLDDLVDELRGEVIDTTASEAPVTKAKTKAKAKPKPKTKPSATKVEASGGDEDKMECNMCFRELAPEAFDSDTGMCMECENQPEDDNLFGE